MCEDDKLLPEAVQRGTIETTGADTEFIEDAGHDPFVGRTDSVVQIIGEFVASLYADGSDIDNCGASENGDDGDDGDGNGDGNEGGDSDETGSVATAAESEPKPSTDGEFAGKPLRRSTTAPPGI